MQDGEGTIHAQTFIQGDEGGIQAAPAFQPVAQFHAGLQGVRMGFQVLLQPLKGIFWRACGLGFRGSGTTGMQQGPSQDEEKKASYGKGHDQNYEGKAVNCDKILTKRADRTDNFAAL
jgi:hypothetical protein